MFPSADVIATAVYAAARELAPSARVNEVALNALRGFKDVGARKGYGGGYPLARTRAYAAVSLWKAFPEANKAAIVSRVGLGYADVWASNMERDLKIGAPNWWSDIVEKHVHDAIVWAMGRPPFPRTQESAGEVAQSGA